VKGYLSDATLNGYPFETLLDSALQESVIDAEFANLISIGGSAVLGRKLTVRLSSPSV